MYKEQIKEILMKTYDVCAYTLDCGSSAVRGNKLYYYTLNKDYEKEIILLRNVLESQLSKNSIGCLNELMQHNRKNDVYRIQYSEEDMLSFPDV